MVAVPRDWLKVTLAATGATAVPATLAYIAWYFLTETHRLNLERNLLDRFPQSTDFRLLLLFTAVPPGLLVLKWAFGRGRQQAMQRGKAPQARRTSAQHH